MIKKGLTIPPHIFKGIKQAKVGFPKHGPRVLGIDIETDEETGEAKYLVICDGSQSRVIPIHECAVQQFIDSLREYGSKKRKVVCGFHNLGFDLVALLFHQKSAFTHSEIRVEKGDCIIRIFYGNTIWGRVIFRGPSGQPKWYVTLIDTSKFFTQSLDQVAKDLKLDHRKQKYPGQKDMESFIEYARNDGWVQYDLTKHIVQLHRTFDVPIQTGTPSFTARVFRKNFVKQTIPFPPPEAAAMGWLSYHGGKSHMYCTPGWYENCYDIDIISCYAWAMSTIPSLYGKWYKTLKILSPWGIYAISGRIDKSDVPLLYDHTFRPLPGGCDFDRVCISGPEAYRFREAIQIKECYGWVFSPRGSDNPLRDYVRFLAESKIRMNPDDALYHFIKLLANSLYGKFVQTTEDRGVWENGNSTSHAGFRAGGLFNPVIGSWITSLARVGVYNLEQRYGSLDTATDGIKTQQKPEEKDGLGGVRIKGVYNYLMLRNKCCLAFDRTTHKLIPSASTCHGVFVSPSHLLERLLNGGDTYEVRRMNKVRESLRRGMTPNVFRNESRRFNFDKTYFAIPEKVRQANGEERA